MKTLLEMELYYVREYTPTCRFKNIINSTLTLKNLQYSQLQNLVNKNVYF